MIYLVEDDDSIRELVIYTLHSTGMEAQGFAVPSAFWTAMAEQEPDLVLLDIMLPEEDGLEVLKRFEQHGNKTSAGDYAHRKGYGVRSGHRTGLRCRRLCDKALWHDGADGTHQGGAAPFGEGRWGEDSPVRRPSGQPKRHLISAGGTQISLTLKEFELLCLLLENQGVVFTRDQLLNRIWGYSFDGESRTVDVHVRHLRQKLGDCGAYIETVRGIGYRLGDGSV